MEISNELNEAIKAWKNENEDNRAIIFIGVERKDLQENGDCNLSTCGIICGNSIILEDAMYHILKDRDKKKENPLPRIIKRAMGRIAMEDMCEVLDRKIKDIDRMMEKLGLSKGKGEEDKEAAEDNGTAAEKQGKETSHE
jgi:hypothetical protein